MERCVWTRPVLAALVGAVVSLAPLGAAAQALPADPVPCADGRVAVDGGYCCWPGQHFDEEHGRCAGPPACPSTRVAAGADCLEREPTPPVPAAVPPVRPAAPARPPPPPRAASETVQIEILTSQGDLTLHRRSAMGPLVVSGQGFTATGMTVEYALVSRAPGVAELDRGTYQLAVALGDRLPMPAGQPLSITRDMTLAVSYEDRFPLNLVGWGVMLAGAGVAVGLIVAAVQGPELDWGLMGAGLGAAGAGFIAGMVLVNLSDVATVREVRGRRRG